MCHLSGVVFRNVQSLVEQGQKGELTMQPGKSMMESLEASINKVYLFSCVKKKTKKRNRKVNFDNIKM